MLFRYRAWDGTQEIDPLTAEELLEALADELLDNDDIETALRNILRYGDQGMLDHRIEGIQKLLERLREQRKEQLQQYDTGSILDDIARRLEQILQHEREAIEERRQRASQQEGSPSQQSPSATTQPSTTDPLPASAPDQPSSTSASPTDSSSSSSPVDQRMRDVLRRLADQKESELNQLPPDVPGRIRQLQNYEFLSPKAQEEFQQLLDELRGQMARQYFQGLQQAIQGLTPEDLQRLRDMVRELNKLLDSALQGQSPDASDFLQKFGDFFPGANSLEDILQQLAQRASQMSALMNSLSREQRSQLQQMLDSLFRDDRLQWDMARLAASLNQLLPREARGYHFSGDESLSLREALHLMEQLQQMDTLEQQLQRAQRQGANVVDPELAERTLGREARQQLEQMNSLAQILEDAGFIRRRGDRLELTARGVRRIGQKALQEIFTELKKDRLGNHDVATQGRTGERSDNAKVYEFGDPFLLDLQGTIRHAILRQGPQIPVQLQSDDFEVYRTEHRTEVSTVLMIDLSRSMLYNGCYAAAKRVTLA
ncbi:MAG: VWA domain-containing protein, partial [Chloroflexi bacterium]|nr:VWA domain-containing protein [Chloroflexota bacterium]